MGGIPKILHQVWLGENPMPEKYIEWRDHWRQLHPDWEYVLHTDDTIKNILPEELYEYMEKCKKYSSKSNIVRLYVINKYGGIYCDTDFEWNKNIDVFLNNEFVVAKQHGSLYCNAFFGSVSNNPIIKYQLDLLVNFIKKSPPWGPDLMTLAVKKYIDEVTILPTKYIYPYMWFETYKPGTKFPEAYIIHHWSKSWV